MTSELRQFENLGSPDYFVLLYDSLNKSEKDTWSIEEITGIFYNKILDGRYIFDGCLHFAIIIGIISKVDKGYKLNPIFSSIISGGSDIMDEIRHRILVFLSKDETFIETLQRENLSFDVYLKSYAISNNVFGVSLSNIKQILLDFQLIYPHPLNHSTYIIQKEFLDIVCSGSQTKTTRKIGIKEFEKSLENQRIQGETAEKYVLNFEQNRLRNLKTVEWVSIYIVNEGYDIASYNKETDTEFSRFIEVKSFSGLQPYFYWSRNEIEIASVRKESYWIYLVDVTKIMNPSYIPMMIQNPALHIFQQDSWKVQSESYKIELVM